MARRVLSSTDSDFALTKSKMFGTVILAFLSCGLVSGNSLSRIINGTETDTTKHPHQVSLEYLGDSGEFRHSCGGSIIGATWVLTAAHCVDGRDSSRLRIAVNDGSLSDENEQYFALKRMIIHPNYTSNAGLFEPAYPNDIALLELTEVIPSGSDKVITLATGTLDSKECTITGWGLDENNVIPDVLQETSGTILTEAGCRKAWNEIFPGVTANGPYSHRYHVCINNAFTGSCNGDSGGPMVCDNQLAGVTSWGANGCDTAMPSVYVRVPEYVEWIEMYVPPEPTFL